MNQTAHDITFQVRIFTALRTEVITGNTAVLFLNRAVVKVWIRIGHKNEMIHNRAGYVAAMAMGTGAVEIQVSCDIGRSMLKTLPSYVSSVLSLSGWLMHGAMPV